MLVFFHVWNSDLMSFRMFTSPDWKRLLDFSNLNIVARPVVHVLTATEGKPCFIPGEAICKVNKSALLRVESTKTEATMRHWCHVHAAAEFCDTFKESFNWPSLKPFESGFQIPYFSGQRTFDEAWQGIKGEWFEKPRSAEFGQYFVSQLISPYYRKIWFLWDGIADGRLAVRTITKVDHIQNILLSGWRKNTLRFHIQVQGDAIMVPPNTAFAVITLPPSFAYDSICFSASNIISFL